jgi:hypothetical protein
MTAAAGARCAACAAATAGWTHSSCPKAKRATCASACRAVWPRQRLNCAAQRSGPTLNAVLSSLAADAPRGDLPRAFVGEQNYWTLVGVDGGGDRSGLISEDGAIEIGRGGFSVEPSVQLADGRRITWADVQQRHSLPEGHLPLPQVHWATRGLCAGHAGHCRRPGRSAATAGALHPAQHEHTRADLHADAGAAALAGEPAAAVPEHTGWRQPRAGAALGWPGPAGCREDCLRFTQAPQRVTALPLDGGLSLAALAGATARCMRCGTRRPWPRRRCSSASRWPRVPATRWAGPHR